MNLSDHLNKMGDPKTRQHLKDLIDYFLVEFKEGIEMYFTEGFVNFKMLSIKEKWAWIDTKFGDGKYFSLLFKKKFLDNDMVSQIYNLVENVEGVVLSKRENETCIRLNIYSNFNLNEPTFLSLLDRYYKANTSK